MSTIVCSLTYFDEGIFWSFFCYNWLSIDLRVLDIPSCSFCTNLAWFYNSILTFFKFICFYYIVAKWKFFLVFYLTFGISTYFYNSLCRSFGFSKFTNFSFCYGSILDCKSYISLLFSGFTFLNFFDFTWISLSCAASISCSFSFTIFESSIV